MKKLSLILIFIMNSFCGYTQTGPDLGGLYSFKLPEQLPSCDMYGANQKDKEDIPAGFQFNISRSITGGYVIVIVRWKKNDTFNKLYRGTASSIATKYYWLTATQFTNSCEQLQQGGTVSLVTASTLIKFRPGRFNPIIGADGKAYSVNTDIGNDFTIGLLASLKFTPADSKKNIYGLVGFNYSAIKVTPATTQDFITSETTVGSVAPTLGLEIQIDKVQIGLISGIDILTGDVNRYWVYRGRPWFGLGIGFNLFKSYGTGTDNSNNDPAN